MDINTMARIIEAEAGVLDFAGKLAVAQCIVDNRYNANAFTRPAAWYSAESMQAAELATKCGARRYAHAKILQFRSFGKYGKGGVPDWQKIYASVPQDLLYLGKDGEGMYGHYYFGRYEGMEKNSFRMLLIAGHGRNVDGSWDPGAVGVGGVQEANLTRELGKLIKQQADINHVPCDVAADRNYYSYFVHGGKYDFTPYNYVLEVHFNAGGTTDEKGDGVLRGTMFYIDRDEKGHSVEDAILANLYAIGAAKAWDGVVITQRQWPNGLGVQRKVREQGVSHAVLETCFVNDRDDMSWYQAKKKLIATKVIEGIIKGFGLAGGEGNLSFVGKGIATAEALEDMNVRGAAGMAGELVGLVRTAQRVEVLEKLPNGWLKIVWPGASCGFAYTSNAGGKYYRFI